MKFDMRRPDDFHVHLRDGELLADVIPYTALVFGRALCMGNLRLEGHPSAVEGRPPPPVLTGHDAIAYMDRIEYVRPRFSQFEPLMTIIITDETTPTMIRQAKSMGVVAGKIYPKGLTTNSEWGVSNFLSEGLQAVFATMEEVGMVLCLHGEESGVFCMDRERAFVQNTLSHIARHFRNLKIVLEHITTAVAVHAVQALGPNVAGTITVHHLELTLDDVVGGRINPHNFCKPIAKRPEDKQALRAAAFSGSPKFFLGTDSAPHLRHTKECAHGCAGVFTAPVALSVLAAIFEEIDEMDVLEPFCSEHGARFYGLPLNEDRITLVRKRWKVPEHYDNIVPYKAGQVLQWQVEGIDFS